MRSSKLLAVICAAVMSAYGTVTQAADVVIGVPDWPSVRATAHVLKVVLEKNLGLEVELQDGTNTSVFKAMDTGAMQVHPEVWLPNMEHLTKQYVDAKQSVKMGSHSVAGEQAMCVTKDTAERTGIVNLSQLTEPQMAKHFDTDGDGKGEVWIGATDWASTTIERIRARSYGYDQTMTLKEMDEASALAEVANAVDKGENIVFFCYSPHYMFTLHELVPLKEPAYDQKQWMIVQPSATPGWLERSIAATAWDTASLHVSYATALETDQPQAATVLSKVSLDADTLSAMTHALIIEKQDPAEFAANWVEQNADRVSSWLP